MWSLQRSARRERRPASSVGLAVASAMFTIRERTLLETNHPQIRLSHARFGCVRADRKSHTVMFALYVEAELEKWDEDGQRMRRWFDLGVPNSPYAKKQLEAVRAQLSPKPVHQRVLTACERLRAELAREGEQNESAWGRPRQRRTGARSSENST